MIPELIAHHARDTFRKPTGRSNKTDQALDTEIQQSLIGTTYNVASEAWNLINPGQTQELVNAEPKHLLWALVFLTLYCTEAVLTRLVGGVDNKTYRKWSNRFAGALSGLKQRVIIWGHRFIGWDGVKTSLITVDGVDCAIEERYPFNEKIFSKKLNGPGYKYEVGVCIATGHIVWINGSFLAGIKVILNSRYIGFMYIIVLI